MKTPVVSVIIPTYNRGIHMRRSVLSVLDQTYRDFELIIVDDASTDNTEDIVKDFNDKRIRYIRHDNNKGAPAARNSGIKAARGEFIAFQDSDDEWFPMKLEKQMHAFKEAASDVGVVYTGLWRLDGKHKTFIPSSSIKHKNGDIHRELLKRSFIGTPSMMVRKECFNKTGMFDETLLRLQDWELVIRLSRHYKFKYIGEALLNAHLIDDSISVNNRAHIQAFESIIMKHYDDFNKNKHILAKHYFSLGVFLSRNSEVSRARENFSKANRLHPRNPTYMTILILSLLNRHLLNLVLLAYWKTKRVFN